MDVLLIALLMELMGANDYRTRENATKTLDMLYKYELVPFDMDDYGLKHKDLEVQRRTRMLIGKHYNKEYEVVVDKLRTFHGLNDMEKRLGMQFKTARYYGVATVWVFEKLRKKKE